MICLLFSAFFFIGFCVNKDGPDCSSGNLYRDAGLTCPASLDPLDRARAWNDALLGLIRADTARPVVHARNLYHLSTLMWDCWIAYEPDSVGKQLFHVEKVTDWPGMSSQPLSVINKNRAECISYGSYKLLIHRFQRSPARSTEVPKVDELMSKLGYDKNFADMTAKTSRSLGLRIAQTTIDKTINDGSFENDDYDGFKAIGYKVSNLPLNPYLAGNPNLTKPSHYQELLLKEFVGQSGINQVEFPKFVGPHWGKVTPYALDDTDATTKPGWAAKVYLDPGTPAQHGSAEYTAEFNKVLKWSSYLDPADGVKINISPNSLGNNALGTNNGKGRTMNPVTNKPYEDNIVLRGDYTRILAEFWADGPDSETPPGHWNTIVNWLNEYPDLKRQLRGSGRILDKLEWDIKVYLSLNGALHDAAIAAWSVKGFYDSTRPISAIRWMCDRGQSTDRTRSDYHPSGIPLEPGFTEIITAASAAPGGKHETLGHMGEPQKGSDHIGKIAVKAWKGHNLLVLSPGQVYGVGWKLCGKWWPYQRPNFVTPPFAGYVSGHSTFSRAAAETLTSFTGTPYFPGGLGVFTAPKDKFLVFESGPSVETKLTWATYYDAADECSLSRIYGGIHPSIDDIPGRKMGDKLAKKAWIKSWGIISGTPITRPPEPTPPLSPASTVVVNFFVLLTLFLFFNL